MLHLLAETPTGPLAADAVEGLQGLDYVVVGVYLLGVLAVGVYFSRHQSRSEDYFVGGRQMPWLAVGLSIMASLLSTISYLASPGEMNKNGPTMALAWLVVPFVFVVVSFVWLPFLMKLKLTSVYEYLDRRFGARAGKLASILFVFVLRLFWMGMVSMNLAVLNLLPIPIRAFFSVDRSSSAGITEAPPACLIAIVVTAAMCLVLFFYPAPILQLVAPLLH